MIEMQLKKGDNELSDYEKLSKRKSELLERMKKLLTQLENLTYNKTVSTIRAQQMNSRETEKLIGDEISKLDRELKEIDNELIELMEIKTKKT